MNNLTTRHKILLLAALYVSQGIPFGIFSYALPALLREQGASLKAIGWASVVALPWALKFLWAPLLDRYYIARIGRRRSWLLPLQMMAVSLLIWIAFIDTGVVGDAWLYTLLAALFFTNLVAATQDIATDGLAVETLSYRERGFGNGIQVAGYRIGMIFGGGLLLMVMGVFGWNNSFLLLALLLALATLPVFFFREERLPRESDSSSGHYRWGDYWAVYKGFVCQPGMWAWLLLMGLYKCGDSLGSAMVKPMLIDLGWSLVDIGWIVGTVGSIAGLSGALIGGTLVVWLGRYRSMMLFIALQALTLFAYGGMALGEFGTLGLYCLSFAEHFTGGMATAALFTLMMDSCRKAHAGADYTVQASIQVTIAGSMHVVAGYTAQNLGYFPHFMLAGSLGLLTLLPVWLFFSYNKLGLSHR